MLPHEITAELWEHPQIFFPLFVGAPGDVEAYWNRSPDLEELHADLDGLRDHVLPMRLYGDSADSTKSQNFELMSILPVLAVASNTLDTRIVVSVRSTGATSSKASHKINEVLAWSFEAMRRMAERN